MCIIFTKLLKLLFLNTTVNFLMAFTEEKLFETFLWTLLCPKSKLLMRVQKPMSDCGFTRPSIALCCFINLMKSLFFRSFLSTLLGVWKEPIYRVLDFQVARNNSQLKRKYFYIRPLKQPFKNTTYSIFRL